ncbi:MAG: class I SAM-dependent methyltransferase [Vicinamibacteraceae bacterium]
MFDKIYRSAEPGFTPAPNALLLSAIAGRPPGRALDIAMGQGRNALALAKAGWDVTGFDVSPAGLTIALADAAHAGVALTTRLAAFDRFDYGEAQWDLIAVIYAPRAITQPPFSASLMRALRPGGIVVVENFAAPAGSPDLPPADNHPVVLLRAFDGCRILRFEDTDGVTDWTPQTRSLVRLVAERRP